MQTQAKARWITRGFGWTPNPVSLRVMIPTTCGRWKLASVTICPQNGKRRVIPS